MPKARYHSCPPPEVEAQHAWSVAPFVGNFSVEELLFTPQESGTAAMSFGTLNLRIHLWAFWGTLQHLCE